LKKNAGRRRRFELNFQLSFAQKNNKKITKK